MEKFIVVLDDDERRLEEFYYQLINTLPQYQQIFFDNAPDLIEWLKENTSTVILISLDHDLGPNRSREGRIVNPGTGRDVVNFLITELPFCPIVIHSSNAMAVTGMKFALEFADWQVNWTMPSKDLEWINLYWIPEIIKILTR